MVELTILFGIYILVSGAIIGTMYRLARDERRELEDKLMALSKPSALVTHKALKDENPAKVTYVDDEPLDPEFSVPGHSVD